MYRKSKDEILNLVEGIYLKFEQEEDFKCEPELANITFSKDEWFNIIDINLIKCDKELVIKNLKALLSQIVDILKIVKGDNLCFKYFKEEKVYSYVFNNIELLKDLNLDMYLLELFLLL